MARPTWGQVRRFCTVQGYHQTRTDHDYFDKALPDGSSSGTKVSFGRDSEQLPAGLWRRVWRHQLRLKSEGDFWRGLEGAPVTYDIPPTPEPATPLPPYLARFLRDILHYTEEQIAATTRKAAQDLLNAHYASELREP